MRLFMGFAIGLALCLCGCSSSNVVPVSGVVLMDGQPLADATVRFQPEAQEGLNAGIGSVGRTDANGRYTLELASEEVRRGAVIGKHRVRVTSLPLGSNAQQLPDAGDGGPTLVLPKDRIPARYNTNSELIFEVPSGGTDKADFDLKSS